MKLVIALAALTLLSATAAYAAEVSCENDRICGDGQKCIDGYCKDSSALKTHGTLQRREGASKIPHGSDSKIPSGRQ